ncbi:hypothetical protein BSQ33_08945 [Vibrio gazogenes]|uniref:Uncharacterized protein n=1 Tax=Vibrio gazogenes TaxID=687 RepID=A0A1Z2SF91_VIBGA|nr:hypothetical protein BSQ33_08945 [Vibrio gazogenes]
MNLNMFDFLFRRPRERTVVLWLTHLLVRARRFSGSEARYGILFIHRYMVIQIRFKGIKLIFLKFFAAVCHTRYIPDTDKKTATEW